jgi:polar amino acid transport system substrate-binding protein
VTWSMLRGVLLLPLFLVPAMAQDADTITLYYDYRPPLISVEETGRIGGILAEPVTRIFAKAQLPVRWVRAPAKRTRALFKASTGNDCSFGWYKTAERETYAVYSLPFYLDKPPAGLVRADYSAKEWANLADLLAHTSVNLALRDGVAYGDYIDGLIAKMPAGRVTKLDTDSVPIARMIYSGRSDLTILPIEEVSQVISAAGLKPSDFRILFFADLPHQDYRHVVCSKATDPKLVARINQAIKDLGLP